ncbi:unnamed protein product, partial [Vitis vinifera]|uniref:Uncharacterized protein n=1 Tax=Vitis vinifera TaxID=29760 RepID=D7THI3_VITVI
MVIIFFLIKHVGLFLFSSIHFPTYFLHIGIVLKKLFDDGVVKREDLWVTSKLWCADRAPEDKMCQRH